MSYKEFSLKHKIEVLKRELFEVEVELYYEQNYFW